MELFLYVMQSGVDLLTKQMSIYGFSFSLFDICLYSSLAGLTARLIVGLIK